MTHEAAKNSNNSQVPILIKALKFNKKRQKKEPDSKVSMAL
jgi:hypothetical protein